MKLLTPARTDAFGKWQVDLIWRKPPRAGKQDGEEQALEKKRAAVRARQSELRDAVTEGAAATARYLRRVLFLEKEELAGIPALPRRLTPGEYLKPPLELEAEIGDAWWRRPNPANQVTPRNAARPLFWLVCHIDWLEQGLLGDVVYPALMGGEAVAGARDDRDRQEKETRNFLRRTGGLPAVRGNVSVLSDCPISRAWWRRRFARSAARHAGEALDVDVAHRSLHRSQPVWEELVRLGVWRLTVINHARTRAALIAALASGGDWRREEMAVAARSAAREAIGRSLDQVPWSDLHGLVATSAAQARAAS